jgi:hypothetical protein
MTLHPILSCLFFIHKGRIYSRRKRKEEGSGQGEWRKVNKYREKRRVCDKNGILHRVRIRRHVRQYSRFLVWQL